MLWGERQAQLVDSVLSDGTRTVVASGPVRSGKSYSGNWAWIAWARRWTDTHFGLTAVSDGRVRATMMEMEAIALRLNMPWVQRERHVDFGEGRRLWFFVANNRTAAERIAGHTWAGAVIDEGTKVEPGVLGEINNRCALAGGLAKVLITTNPSSPTHRLMTDVMQPIEQGKRPGAVHYFGIDDNPAMSDVARREIHDGLPEGFIRDRDYYGKWVEAGGAVYPGASQWVRQPPQTGALPIGHVVTIDPATTGVTHALLMSEYPGGRWWVTSEWRHDGWQKGPMPRHTQVAKIAAWAFGLTEGKVRRWLVDPADPAFREQLADELRLRDAQVTAVSVPDFDKPGLLESIRAVNTAGQTSRVLVSPVCVALVRELTQLGWDENAAMTSGEERPVDGNDHGADALRYAVWNLGMWR